MTITTKPAKVERILKTATTERLIEIHEMLSHMMFDNLDPISKEQFLTRLWVEDELEKRDPIAYDRWLDDAEPGASPRKYYL